MTTTYQYLNNEWVPTQTPCLVFLSLRPELTIDEKVATQLLIKANTMKVEPIINTLWLESLSDDHTIYNDMVWQYPLTDNIEYDDYVELPKHNINHRLISTWFILISIMSVIISSI